ncbi:MAG: peptidylprolyl isomerase [Polyangiales bacterium]
MRRLLLTWALGLSAFLTGCTHTVATTVRPPDLPMIEVTARPPTPEVIALRVAVVTYQGAEGAPEEITRTRDQAEARAVMLAGLARQPGQSFREIVSEYSDVPSGALAVRHGDSRLPPVVVDAAFELAVGERSRAVETPRGFYIVAREEDPVVGPTEIWARHVLISFVEARRAVEGVTRSRDEALALAEQVRDEARAQPERFAELAGQYSDEPGAADRGGDLGPFGRGAMVPAFERAAFALEVGAVSDVVETPFGFHVIQRYR